MFKMIKRFLKEEDGINTVEIVVVIAILVGLALLLKGQILGIINKIFGQLNNATDDLISTK